MSAIHLDPDVWQDLNKTQEDPKVSSAVHQGDEFAFRPSRWVNPAGSSQPLFQSPKGSFLPWSVGPRVCPGQKMAQVEFTAIFLTLFRRHRIEAVPLTVSGRAETEDEINARLDALMEDSMSILTLQMKGVYEANEGDGKGLNIRLRRRD